MKYSVQVEGEAALGLPEQDYEGEAADAREATDFTRARLGSLLPKEGGELHVTITLLEAWSFTAVDMSGVKTTVTLPAGHIVSRWSFYTQPHPDVRVVVEARANDAALALLGGRERSRERARLLHGLSIAGVLTQEAFLDALAGDDTLASLVEKALAAKGVQS